MAERIREEILSGRLRPGWKLIENDLAERYGTSRGPVREAIRELAREGLVAEVPRRGTVVSTLTAHDLSEVYGVREALEIGACKAVIERASDEAIRSLEEPLRAMDGATRTGEGYMAVAEHDLAFHRRLVALAGNDRMVAINDQMLAQTALLLRTAAESSPALRGGMDRPVHRELLEALLARDPERTRAAVEAHYRYAEERLFDDLQ